MACDLRTAVETTKLHIAFVKVGLVPDSGMSFWLAEMLCLARATEITLLGEAVDAQTALRLGLVNWVFPADRLNDEVQKVTERLATVPIRA